MDCPLSPVERRLEDVAALWKRASDAYFDPDEFRLQLQSCIQAFRTVTWVLQKNKHLIKDFDNWYSGWQNKMRGDAVLRWSVEARNFIEKQGDLETKSKLKATVSASWLTAGSLEGDFPPSTKMNEIGGLILALSSAPVGPPGEAAFIQLERRWVDSALSEHEVLEALVHCFSTIQELIHDAHGVLASGVPADCGFYNHLKSPDHIPDFMVDPATVRIVWLKLKDRQIIEIGHERPDLSPEDFQRAREHYHLDNNSPFKLSESSTFREECVALFNAAKHLLQVDGFHKPIAVMKTEHGPELMSLSFDDRAEKHIVIREAARLAKKNRAKSVILINEAWVFSAEAFKKHGFAVPVGEKKEALVLHGLTSDGDHFDRQVVFERVEGKIVFREEVDHDAIPNILLPFCDVWNIKRPKNQGVAGV